MSARATVSSSYGWPTDALSTFLRQAEENTFASSVNLGTNYGRLVSAHALWVRAAETLAHSPEGEVLAVWFLNMSNSAWLAAVRVSLGGQMVEAQPLLRNALEYAGYALHFMRAPNLQETWFRRHDSSEAREAVLAAFSMGQVKRTLQREGDAISSQCVSACEWLRFASRSSIESSKSSFGW